MQAKRVLQNTEATRIIKELMDTGLEREIQAAVAARVSKALKDYVSKGNKDLKSAVAKSQSAVENLARIGKKVSSPNQQCYTLTCSTIKPQNGETVETKGLKAAHLSTDKLEANDTKTKELMADTAAIRTGYIDNIQCSGIGASGVNSVSLKAVFTNTEFLVTGNRGFVNDGPTALKKNLVVDGPIQSNGPIETKSLKASGTLAAEEVETKALLVEMINGMDFKVLKNLVDTLEILDTIVSGSEEPLVLLKKGKNLSAVGLSSLLNSNVDCISKTQGEALFCPKDVSELNLQVLTTPGCEMDFTGLRVGSNTKLGVSGSTVTKELKVKEDCEVGGSLSVKGAVAATEVRARVPDFHPDTVDAYTLYHDGKELMFTDGNGLPTTLAQSKRCIVKRIKGDTIFDSLPIDPESAIIQVRDLSQNGLIVNPYITANNGCLEIRGLQPGGLYEIKMLEVI